MTEEVKNFTEGMADMTGNILHTAVDAPVSAVKKMGELGEEAFDKGVDVTDEVLDDTAKIATSPWDDFLSQLGSCFGLLK